MSVALAGGLRPFIVVQWPFVSTFRFRLIEVHPPCRFCPLRRDLASLLRPEAHRAPHVVDRDLTDALDVLLQEVPPENVSIQVRPQLLRLGVRDPREAILLRRFHRRSASLVHVCERPDETRMPSAFADEVTSTSSRSTPGGLATTRTFIPSFRFIFFASLIDDRPPFVSWRPMASVRAMREFTASRIWIAPVRRPRDRSIHDLRTLSSLSKPAFHRLAAISW